MTGFEPAPHAVTGRYCIPFNHTPIWKNVSGRYYPFLHNKLLQLILIGPVSDSFFSSQERRLTRHSLSYRIYLILTSLWGRWETNHMPEVFQTSAQQPPTLHPQIKSLTQIFSFEGRDEVTCFQYIQYLGFTL